MKKHILTLLITILSFSLSAQNVGVNTTGGIPNASAGLDVDFTDKGLLIPRVALTASNAAAPITTPATSLLIYNTATVAGVNAVSPGFYYWNGAQWLSLSSGAVDTDDQTLSMNADTLFIQDGNFVLLSTDSMDWDLNGNYGTNPTTNFVGTRDNQALAFRVNDTLKLRLEINGTVSILNTGLSVFIGENAGLNDDLTKNRNTFIGNDAGMMNTSGSANTGVGLGTIYRNTIGNNNSAFGYHALHNSTTASLNTGVGFGALNFTTIGDSNTSLGAFSGYRNTTGSHNISIGFESDLPSATASDQLNIGNIIYGENIDGGAAILSTGNIGIGVTSPTEKLHVNGGARVTSLVGAGNRMVIANATGVLGTQALPTGDITGVTAGAGLIGGGVTGTVTLNANVNNGVYVNAGADRIRLGGALVENTTITNNAFGMTYNLNGTGDFQVQDNGATRFTVLDNGRTAVGGINTAGQFNVTGNSYFSNEIYLRDGAVNAGDILVRIYDSADDGIIDVYENNAMNHRIHGNGVTVFNEQGNNNADIRMESDLSANMFFLDAGLSRVGIGDATPAATLDVNGHLRLGVGNANAPTYELLVEDATNPGITLGNTTYNNINSGILAFNEAPAFQTTIGTFCGFQFRHDGFANNLYLETGCSAITGIMTFERGGDIGIQLANPGYDLHLGNNSAAKPGTNTWTVASDSLLKEDVNQFKDGLNTLRGINPVYFKYNGKANIKDESYYVGVLAQELEKTAPYMVGTFESEEDNKINTYKSVDNGAMTYVAINAIKELDEKQKILESKVQNVSDFGIEVANGKEVYIAFSADFKNSLSTVPVVTVTPVGANASITIISQTKEGFTIRINSDSAVTLNWIAMSKAKKVQAEKVYTQEERNAMLRKVQVTKANSDVSEVMYDDQK